MAATVGGAVRTTCWLRVTLGVAGVTVSVLGTRASSWREMQMPAADGGARVWSRDVKQRTSIVGSDPKT